MRTDTLKFHYIHLFATHNSQNKLINKNQSPKDASSICVRVFVSRLLKRKHKQQGNYQTGISKAKKAIDYNYNIQINISKASVI